MQLACLAPRALAETCCQRPPVDKQRYGENMIDQPIVPAQSTLRGMSWLDSFLLWLVEGGRTAVFLAPRWRKLQATPAIVAALMLTSVLVDILTGRLYIDGAARFYWQAVAGGWMHVAVIAWVCYLLRPIPHESPSTVAAPGAAHLLCLLLAQAQVLSIAIGLAFAGLIHTGLYGEAALSEWGNLLTWLVPLVWIVLAQLMALLRGGDRRPLAMVIAVLSILFATALWYVVPQARYWYATDVAQNAAPQQELHLTQELMERQPQLLAQRLQDVQPQRPGVVDLYAVGFAPYADEDVFRRESDMVMEVMAQRFDADGRSLQLVNHVETTEQWPWATPLNLQRSIQYLASIMDPDEDVLFLHLTSHGAYDGELAADFWPMEVASITPDDLKAWLDEAGIRHRVISVSACYSGSWIAPLADDNTLIMTAADAEHTSYGCGRKSELTYFGRAMYDEQLRSSTLSFEEAHAAARTVIKEREEKAGKNDGYSNPQISVGTAIRSRLATLQTRLTQHVQPMQKAVQQVQHAQD
jgi:hypothetical protein